MDEITASVTDNTEVSFDNAKLLGQLAEVNAN